MNFRCLIGVFMSALFACAPVTGFAADGSSTLSGYVVDQSNGLPLPAVHVSVVLGQKEVGESESDASGAFSFAQLAPGDYYLNFKVRGYERTRSDDLFVASDSMTTVRVALVRATENSSNLRQIATVRATRGSLQTSSVITERISAAKVINQGLISVGQGLLTLPGVTANDLDSSPGDDLHLQVRGQKASETAALVDGHPIGPLGVQNGFRAGFNYQLSPAWGLSDTEVLYGSGGQALYGVDTIGGAVNFRTIDAGGGKSLTFYQGAGNQGRSTTIVGGAGSIAGWDYGFSYGVQGSDGPFSGQTITQSALLGQTSGSSYLGDVSPGNVAANTWRVTGDYITRSGVLKLRRQLSPQTNLTLTAFNAQSFDDKTGEGDNDYWTPEYAGYVFDQSAGSFAGCAGIPVKVDDAGTTSCYNRAQWASAFAGPNGGTSTAWQTQRLQDYSARISSSVRNNQIAAQFFIDSYNLIYNRDDSGHTNNFTTYGLQLSDDVVTAKNDLGFGIYNYNQTERDNNFTFGGAGNGLSYFPAVNGAFQKYFIRDTWTPSSQITAFASGWLNQDSVTNKTSFDPRLTLMYRPSTRDVVRVSAGRAQGLPQASLVLGAVQFNNAPGNITTANCSPSGVTSVASGANPSLQAEKATDFELSVGHRFSGDSQIQVTAFSQYATNVIFGDVVGLQSAGLMPPGTLLQQYINRISGLCGHAVTIANLGETTTDNAGTGRTRGLNINGRVRLSRSLFTDYGWNVVDTRLYDIPDRALASNGTLVPGMQVDKVPVHTGNLGVEFQGRRGLDLRLDGYYVGSNNALVRPAYAYANGSISQTVKNVTFTLGGFNIFNSHYQQYGLIGYGTFQPENSHYSDANVLQQAFNCCDGEQFGLPHASFIFSISEKL